MRLSQHQSTVKVDVDAGKPLLTVRDITRLLRRAGYRPIAMAQVVSPSGNGHHLYIHVSPRPSSPFEVVALQLLLGSDVDREAMQMFRARGFAKAPRWMRDHWNVLYLPHDMKGMRRVHLEPIAAEAGAVVVTAKT